MSSVCVCGVCVSVCVCVLCFLNSANLICRATDIVKYFRDNMHKKP